MTTPPPMPPSLNEMLARDHMESFYRDMYGQAERTIQHLITDNASLREQVGMAQAQAALAQDDTRRAREDAREWFKVAVKLGSDVTAEWKKSEFAMHGDVSIAAEVLYSGGNEAVHQVCLNLAKKIIGERKAHGYHPDPDLR